MKKIIIIAVLFLFPIFGVIAVTPTPIPPIVMYELPYPGLLPTHPMYFLKHIRDVIIENLIRDPVKKVEFYILQADKKLQMATVLADSNNAGEATSVFVLSQKSREKAVTILESLGQTVPGFLVEKMQRSLEKHKEVVQSRDMDTNSIQSLLDRVTKLLL